MFFEDNYHLEECQFMFRDEYPYKVYIGPKMEEGYHSLCIWTDSQLGSKTLFGNYSDYAALQTILGSVIKSLIHRNDDQKRRY